MTPALHQSDNLLAISDNAISIINKSLSSHIKQIQIDCKESIEQHIKKDHENDPSQSMLLLKQEHAKMIFETKLKWAKKVMEKL